MRNTGELYPMKTSLVLWRGKRACCFRAGMLLLFRLEARPPPSPMTSPGETLVEVRE